MSAGLPTWALWLQAIGPGSASIVTALVAVAVWIVAYRQWRTAREKLVLDLFDRRFDFYVNAKEAIEQLLGDPQGSIGVRSDRGLEPIKSMYRLRLEGQFLFGEDVMSYTARVYSAMINLQLGHTMSSLKDTSKDWSQVINQNFKVVTAFHDEFPKIAAPYMRMGQKL